MALEIYRARSFRDLKGLAMPKGFETAVGLLVGESRGLLLKPKELIRLAGQALLALVALGRVPSPI